MFTHLALKFCTLIARHHDRYLNLAVRTLEDGLSSAFASGALHVRDMKIMLDNELFVRTVYGNVTGL